MEVVPEAVVVLAMVTVTPMTAEEAMAVVMTMAHAAHVTTTAVMAEAVVVVAAAMVHDVTTMVREASTVMHLTVATAAGIVDVRIVEAAEAVEAATTTVLLLQLPAPVVTTAHLLHVRRTAEAARTRVTTTVLTASSSLTVPEPKRY